MKMSIETITATIGVIGSYIFGGWDLLLQTLLAFIVLDLITGVVGGFYNKNLDSKIMSRGIIRKAYEMLIVVVAFRLDQLAETTIFRTFACYFFIANEGLSILENVGKFIEYPEFIKNFLTQLKKTGNEGKEDGKS